ncbi:MAG: radical SAM protein, partial [Planctomycetaceae bacterium]|nr:radical SAM protein [Planctomycetaceae bacterium]
GDEGFAGVPGGMQRVNDVAFSGDGEPTSYGGFSDAVGRAIALRDRHGLSDVKIAVLSNATLFHRPTVRAGLDLLAENNGEIWAKLDAGTEAYYRLIDRTSVPLDRVMANLLTVGRGQAIVIQSLFMAVHGEAVGDDEFEAYVDRLGALLDGGCRIKLVQLYTTARRPAESYVTRLDDDRLDAMAARLRARLPGLACEVYYGAGE